MEFTLQGLVVEFMRMCYGSRCVRASGAFRRRHLLGRADAWLAMWRVGCFLWSTWVRKRASWGRSKASFVGEANWTLEVQRVAYPGSGFSCVASWTRSRASFVGEASWILEVRGVAYPGVGVRVWCRGQGAGLLSWARRIGHWKCEELQTQSVLFVYGAVDEELVFFRVRGHEVIGSTTGCSPRSGFVSGFGGYQGATWGLPEG